MSQRGLILRLLREAGTEGVDAHELVYRHGITQVAARIWELRDQGHDIDTIDRGIAPDGRRRLCSYILREEGTAPKAAPESATEWTAAPLLLPCGCARAADGRSWLERCAKHDTSNKTEAMQVAAEIQW